MARAAGIEAGYMSGVGSCIAARKARAWFSFAVKGYAIWMASQLLGDISHEAIPLRFDLSALNSALAFSFTPREDGTLGTCFIIGMAVYFSAKLISLAAFIKS
jgi:hypothetical protein